jgi:hypothetical protein
MKPRSLRSVKGLIRAMPPLNGLDLGPAGALARQAQVGGAEERHYVTLLLAACRKRRRRGGSTATGTGLSRASGNRVISHATGVTRSHATTYGASERGVRAIVRKQDRLAESGTILRRGGATMRRILVWIMHGPAGRRSVRAGSESSWTRSLLCARRFRSAAAIRRGSSADPAAR